MPPLIRKATAEDTARIGAIARAAYGKYVPRIGREPAPMVADFAAEVAAGHVVVIETAGAVDGYMIAWPEADAYLIDNIAIDPARQGDAPVSERRILNLEIAIRDLAEIDAADRIGKVDRHVADN